MGSIKEKYTTKTLSTKDPVGEKDKMELSNDAYAIIEAIEYLKNVMGRK